MDKKLYEEVIEMIDELNKSYFINQINAKKLLKLHNEISNEKITDINCNGCLIKAYDKLKSYKKKIDEDGDINR